MPGPQGSFWAAQGVLGAQNHRKPKKTAKNQSQIVRIKNVKNLKFKEPQGAFYFYLNIEKLGVNSVELSNKILEETGVVVTPGNDFDKKYGLNFIRLAFSGKKEKTVKGIKKLVKWFNDQ